MGTIVITDEDAMQRGIDEFTNSGIRPNPLAVSELDAACGLYENTTSCTDAGPFYLLRIESVDGELTSKFLMGPAEDEYGCPVAHEEEEDILVTFHCWDDADDAAQDLEGGDNNISSPFFMVYSKQAIIEKGHSVLEKE